jgi:hypothetical protein
MARFPNTHLTPRDPNKFASTNMVNELIAAVNAGQPPFVTGQGRPVPYSDFAFPAKIVSAGPNGEPNYTDERYWVKPLFVAGGKVEDTLNLLDDKILLPGKFATATNLVEWAMGSGAGGGPHALPPGTIVFVRTLVDVGKAGVSGAPDDPARPRFVFDRVPDPVIPVVCVQTSGTGGGSGGGGGLPPTWGYTIKRTFDLVVLNTGQAPKVMRFPVVTLPADFGYAHFDYSSRKYVLGWCNEQPSVTVCP